MHRLPELMRSELLGFEKVAHVVVHQFFQTVDQIRAFVINLAVHQQLPVKLCRHFHGFFLYATSLA